MRLRNRGGRLAEAQRHKEQRHARATDRPSFAALPSLPLSRSEARAKGKNADGKKTKRQFSKGSRRGFRTVFARASPLPSEALNKQTEGTAT